MNPYQELLQKGLFEEAIRKVLPILSDEQKNTLLVLQNDFVRSKKNLDSTNAKVINLNLNRITSAILDYFSEWQIDILYENLPTSIPFPLNALDNDGYLIGRGKDLERLNLALEKSRRLILVNGIGGIGKTTLASIYCHQEFCKENYDIIFWLTINDSLDSWRNVFVNAFSKSTGASELPYPDRFGHILKHLKRFTGNNLIVLDNVQRTNDFKDIYNAINMPNLRVLITSRVQFQYFPTFHLKELEETDCIKLFNKYCISFFDEESIVSLVRLVKYHTLLIEFSAKVLSSHKHLHINTLIAQIEKADFGATPFGNTELYTFSQESRNRTLSEITPADYLIQIFPLIDLTEIEQNYLRFLSILPPIQLSINELCEYFDIEQDVAIKNEFIEVLSSLTCKGWLNEEVVGNNNLYYSCHSWVLYALREQLNPTYENCKQFVDKISKIGIWDSYTNYIDKQNLLPVLESILDFLSPDCKQVSDVAVGVSILAEAVGNFQLSLEYHQKALEIRNKIFPPDHDEILAALSNIGLTYTYLGEYHKSYEFIAKVVQTNETKLTPNDVRLAINYNNIGLVCYHLQDNQKALYYHQKALHIYENHNPINLPDIARSCHNLALTHKNLKNYDLAVELGLKSIELFKRDLGENHPNLGLAYKAIATFYYEKGEYANAKQNVEKSLNIFEHNKTLKHPRYIETMELQQKIENAMN